MRDAGTGFVLPVGVALSAAVHLAFFLLLPRPWETEGARAQVRRMDFRIVEPEPPADEPDSPAPAEPESEPEPEPKPQTKAERVQTKRPPPQPTPRDEAPSEPRGEPEDPDPPEPDPAPAEQEPVRFPNKMLTARQGESSWATPPGSGDPAEGPLASPGEASDRHREGHRDGTPGGQGDQSAGRGVRVVALGQLSRKPEAPDLNAALERHYPQRARAQGVEAVAKVKARINPDGSVGPVRIASESVDGYDFGEACRRMLLQSQWSPGLDAQGRPSATWVPYTCRFSVRN